MYKLYAIFHNRPLCEPEVKAYLEFLPQQRRERALRYCGADDRDNCILSYLLLRHALKNCFGLHDPRIEFPPRGKPYLPEQSDVHFNISHCPAGCIVGVSDVPIGVDIQDVRNFSPRLVEYCCSENERRHIAQSVQPNEAFARIWAMKESWLKLSGEGVMTDLSAVDTTQLEDRIAVVRQRDCYIAVACDLKKRCE